MWSPHIHSNTGRVLIKGDTLEIVGVKAAFMLLNFSSYRMYADGMKGVRPRGLGT